MPSSSGKLSSSPETLHFSCDHCGSVLEIPMHLAGLTGPCPYCREIIASPTLEDLREDDVSRVWDTGDTLEVEDGIVVQRGLTPTPKAADTAVLSPMDSVIEVDVEAVNRPKLADDSEEAPPGSSPTTHETPSAEDLTDAQIFSDAPEQEHLGQEAPQPTDSFEQSWQKLMGLPVVEDGAAEMDDAEDDEEGSTVMFGPKKGRHRKGLVKVHSASLLSKVLGYGSLALFIGAITFALLAWRYSEPKDPPPREINLPEDFTTRVQMNQLRTAEMKRRAVQQAISSVQSFLKSGGSGNPGVLKSFSKNSPNFDGAELGADAADELTVTAVVRKPGTESFLSQVRRSDGEGPTFIVEQEADGSAKIHADPLAQQVFALVKEFLSNKSHAPILVYMLARPFSGQYVLAEKADWPKLDLQTPFPSETRVVFVGCAAPQSPAATQIQQRAGQTDWRPIVVELKWSMSQQGTPYIEITDIIPNSWARF